MICSKLCKAMNIQRSKWFSINRISILKKGLNINYIPQYQFSTKQKDSSTNSQSNKDQDIFEAKMEYFKFSKIKLDLIDLFNNKEFKKGIELINQYIQYKERNCGKQYDGYEEDLIDLCKFTLNYHSEHHIQNIIKIEMTNQYIQEKENNFGKKYNGYEEDLMLLCQFTLNDPCECHIQNIIKYSTKAFEIAYQKNNMKICQSSFYYLFFVWRDEQDFPEMNDIVSKMYEITNKSEIQTEDKCEIYSQISQFYLENGDFKKSTECLENYARDLDGLLTILKQEYDKLMKEYIEDQQSGNNQIKYLEEDEEYEESELIKTEERLFNSIVYISSTYVSLAANAIFIRDWQKAKSFTYCSKYMLAELQYQTHSNQERFYKLGIQFAKIHLLSYQEYVLTNDLRQADWVLQKSFNMQKQSVSPQQLESQLIFYYSQYLTFYLHKKDIGSVKKYLEMIENIQEKNKKNNKTNKYNEINAEASKVQAYIKLDRIEDALKSLNTLKKSYEGKKNRPSIRMSVLQLESNYLEYLKNYKKAQELMQECLIISKTFYSENSEQYHQMNIYLNKLMLLEIKQNNNIESQQEQIKQIKINTQNSLETIQSKGTYGNYQVEITQLLQEMIKQ